MSPEDRIAIARSIANQWTFQTSFMVQIMSALQSEGALSEAAIEGLLQRLDANADLLEGEDDQAHATGAVATVRQLLREWREQSGPKPGAR